MSAPTTSPPRRLGDRLLDAGLISQHQLDLALREQKRTGKLLGAVLQELGFVNEQALASFLAQDAQTPTINVNAVEISPDVLPLIPYETCRSLGLLPIRRDGEILTVAMSDPFDVVAVAEVERLTNLKAEVLNAPRTDILEKLGILHEKSGSLEQTIDELMKISGKKGDENTAPMIRVIEQIITAAVHKSASDVHFEPDEKSLRIRIRTDGVLNSFLLVPKDLQDAFIARLKVMANLDVSETRLPQDGRFNFRVGRRDLALRVSCLPTHFGESVVLRILDGGNLLLNISTLGMRQEDEHALTASVQRPHGVILVTGPTGSGKTTTLYTALNAVNRVERSVFTLEDPIEYRLPHIRQTQVNEKIGLTFAHGLRTLLRQDPDVLLVGETRDKETAQLMTRAALTGHLVLSSLHTNDSFGAIPRLVDLGVEAFLLPATLHTIIAQRLVRKLCPSCRSMHPSPCDHMRSFGLPIPEDGPLELWQPKGCPQCRGQGYRGRIAIFEVLTLDEEYASALTSGDASGIREIARKRRMPLLMDDGIRRARRGETTIEEVFRVTAAAT